ncbi:MAG: L-threonylcarbamoyladenylate synthase [Gemmatimonadaceae bacterium]|nr:L-threonylcarbamoyladenylate synthase [Gemmatimonadaceae bacterium]
MTPRIVAATPTAIHEAAQRLRAGELVAFPTETVYGLGAHALDRDAVARIFAAKGRPAWNPVIVHVADVEAARALVTHWPTAAERLATTSWPGPLTLVLPRAPHVPDAVTGGTDTVAVRIPSHPVALALLREADVPIAAPSANRFTQLSPTRAEHVAAALGDRVELILDGGPCEVGIESTVVDCTGATPLILRTGLLDAATLAARLGAPVEVAKRRVVADDTQRASPGMVERHYAPRAEVWLATSADRTEIDAALRTRRLTTPTARVGAIARGNGWAPDGADLVERLPDEPAGYARGLYAALHAFDDAGCAIVVVDAPPADGPWAGVHDRLTRATR